MIAWTSLTKIFCFYFFPNVGSKLFLINSEIFLVATVIPDSTLCTNVLGGTWGSHLRGRTRQDKQF